MPEQKKTNTEKVNDLMAMEQSLLEKAVGQTMKNYNDATTVANLRAMQAAKGALMEFRANKQAEESGDKIFANLSEVLEFLKSAGYKIAKSKIYQDQTLIKRQADGTYLQSEIEKYAKQFLNKFEGGFDGLEKGLEEKLKHETEIAKQKAESLTRKNAVESGMYVLRSETEQMLAVRAAFLKQGLENFIYGMAPRMVEKVGGDPDKTPDLIEFCQKEIETLFDHYAKPMQFSMAYEVMEEEKENAN